MKKLFFLIVFSILINFQLSAKNGNVLLPERPHQPVIEHASSHIEDANWIKQKKIIVYVRIYDAETGEPVLECKGELAQTEDGTLIIILKECWRVYRM